MSRRHKPTQETRGAIATVLLKARPRAFKESELMALLCAEGGSGDPGGKEHPEALLAELEENGVLRKAELRPEAAEYRPLTRYVSEGCTPLEIAVTLKKSGYMSHETALLLNGLQSSEPQSFYVNHEQSPKPAPESPLTQGTIDRAFKARQRQSRFVFRHEGVRYTILNGKNTGRYGVVETKGPSGEVLFVTGLERTLVDSVVRPLYAGGIGNVAEAYRRARKQGASVRWIVKTLEVLDHRYPYHQAIGFLMARAGYTAKDLRPLRELGLEFDVYLDYAMKGPKFDEAWRIYYPQRL